MTMNIDYLCAFLTLHYYTEVMTYRQTINRKRRLNVQIIN